MTDNLIKVHITYYGEGKGNPAGESLWARQISKDTAKLDNIPFFSPDMSLGDLVRFDPETPCNEIIEVLEHVARTRAIIYADKDVPYDEVKARFNHIVSVFKDKDIKCEGQVAGVMSISVPNDISEDELHNIVASLGGNENLITPEDE